MSVARRDSFDVDPVDWTTEQVISVLSEHLRGEDKATLRAHDVDGRTLLFTVTLENLKTDLGITSLNPRGRIMEIVTQLKRRSYKFSQYEEERMGHELSTAQRIYGFEPKPSHDEPLKLAPDWNLEDFSPVVRMDAMAPWAAVRDESMGVMRMVEWQGQKIFVQATRMDNPSAGSGDDHMVVETEDAMEEVSSANHIGDEEMSDAPGGETAHPPQPPPSPPPAPAAPLVEQRTGLKRIQPVLVDPVQPVVERSVSPPKTASPTQAARPAGAMRKRFLPLKAERIDTLLYTDDVGTDIDVDQEEDEFVISRDQQQHPGMELYANRCIRHLLKVNGLIIENWDLGFATRAASTEFIRTQHKDHLRIAIKHYNGEAYLRKHEQQSFTVFDVESPSHVRVHRENSESLSLRWPSGPIQHAGATSVQIVRHADNGVDPKLDPNGNREFNYLAKWLNIDGADDDVPPWGESGDEGEYDMDVWKEMEAERGPKEGVVSKRRSVAALQEGELQDVVDEAIQELIRQWKLTKLPVLEAEKAYHIWRDAKWSKCLEREREIREANDRIDKLESRIFKMWPAFLNAGYPNKDCARKVIKGNLQVTVEEIEYTRWKMAVMRRPDVPARPLPAGRKVSQRDGKMTDRSSSDENGDESPRSPDRNPDDEDGAGSLGSDSDTNAESPSDEDPMDDFIVEDEEIIPIGADHDLLDLDLDYDEDDDGIVSQRRRRPPTPNCADTDMEDSDPNKDETATERANPKNVAPLASSYAPRGSSSPQRHRTFIDLTTPSPSPGPEQDPKHAIPAVASKPTESRRTSPQGNAARNQRLRDLLSSPGTPAGDPHYNLLRELCVTGDVTLNWQLKMRLDELKATNFEGWFREINFCLRGLRQTTPGIEHEMFLRKAVCRLYIAWRFCDPEAKGDQKLTTDKKNDLGKIKTFTKFIQDLDRILETILKIPNDKGPGSSERHPKQADTPLDKMDIDRDDNVPVGPRGRGHKRRLDVDNMDDSENNKDIPASTRQIRRRKELVEDKVATQTQLELHSVHKNLARRRQALTKGGAINNGKVTINFGHLKKFRDIDVRKDIAQHLKPHQVKGIQFLWTTMVEAGLKTGKPTGALLAHTMGLGKTLQVITFLYTLAEAGASEDKRDQIPKELQKSKTLIMCPPTLIDNWVDEFNNWLPYDEGPPSKLREEFIGKIYCITTAVSPPERLKSLGEWDRDGGVLLIGYSMFRDYISKNSTICDILLKGPNIIVADEAHCLKNKNSQLNQAANLFTSKSRIAMTGSPISNHLSEYYAMIQWIHPGYLGKEYDFKHKFMVPIMDGLYCDSTRGEKRHSLKLLQVLKSDLAPLISRADIDVIMSEMPLKTEFMLSLPLTELQTKMYSRFVADRNLVSSSAGFFDVIHLLSLICSHPILFVKCLEEREKPKLEDDMVKLRLNKKALPPAEQQEEDDDMPVDDKIDGKIVAVGDPGKVIAWARPMLDEMVGSKIDHSYKLLAFREILLYSIALGDKVLVFSHSIPTLDLLESVVTNTKVNGKNLSWSRLDGKTAMGTRQKATKDFNAGGCDVFLISTQAGGLGLNLPGANRVIIFDYKWTPMWEQQAVGRAYRLGQKRHVYVYRFRAGGTFEDSLWNTSQYKAQLQSRVVDMKAPMREAFRKGKEHFRPPAEVLKQDLREFEGKDLVLDRMIKEEGYVYDIAYTETFRPDNDDTLTPEELQEADAILKSEQEAREQEARNSLLQQSVAPPPTLPMFGNQMSMANPFPATPAPVARMAVPTVPTSAPVARMRTPVSSRMPMPASLASGRLNRPGLNGSNAPNAPNGSNGPNPTHPPGFNRFGLQFRPGSLPGVFRGPR
ncbi:hypothetical protein BZA05DRAFT_247564 [Tricharina praecox]|uniref:uncharacterized protein n=1 Tax=Tricharina praecox TaxID=43433 RepID=UPI00222103B9|nr:uncharacterized protein BZA05DRAFT_247564 [Tricharina praecox]KAI5854681.1 hypothetical protein BZA05DRAFT_247564 [Tricharina praecox]